MVSGDICFVAAGVLVESRWREKVEVLNVALAPNFVARVADESVHVARPIELFSQQGGSDPQIWHIGLALKAELETGCPSGRLFGEGVATALSVHLLLHYNAFGQVVREYTSGLSPSKLRRVIAYIRENLQHDLTLSELAEAVGLSSHHFRHLFKQSTGLAPHQYLLQCRVERARQLLLQRSNMTVAEIAAAVGFCDQSHLARHMKRLLGVTPKNIREK
jgi:AraC family transcriptional regulator